MRLVSLNGSLTAARGEKKRRKSRPRGRSEKGQKLKVTPPVSITPWKSNTISAPKSSQRRLAPIIDGRMMINGSK